MPVTFRSKLLAGIGLFGLTVCILGCSAMRPGEMRVKDITGQKLGFIKLGKTTREDVLRELGPPTMTAAGGSLLGYRFTLYKYFHHTPESSGNPGLAAATPSYAAQMGRNGYLRCEYGYLMYCNEAIFVFDPSSRLHQYRLFQPFGLRMETE